MSKQEKLSWIKRFTPCLYVIATALVCLYIAWRGRSWANMVFHAETGFLIGAVMAAFFVINISVSRKYLVASSRIPTYISGVMTFLVIYTSMSMVTVDLLQLIIRLFVKDPAVLQQIFFWCGTACILFVLVCTAAAVYKTTRLKVVSYSVPCPKLNRNKRLVLLTDLHIGYYVGAKHIAKMVQQVNELDADMIVISGDLINAGNTNECSELEEVCHLLSQMKSKEGTFAVTGNHDPSAKDPAFQQFLAKSDIHLLEDCVLTEDDLHLVGRNTKTIKRRTLHDLMDGLPQDRPVVVLDHDPIGVQEAVDENADMILCGHTHRGQIFPLNLLVRLLYSKDEFWGCSERQNTHIIVSAGAGFFSMPMRLGSDCEIVSIDMKPQK